MMATASWSADPKTECLSGELAGAWLRGTFDGPELFTFTLRRQRGKGILMWRRIALASVVFALVIAACGDDDDSSGPITTTTTTGIPDATSDTTAPADPTTTATAAPTTAAPPPQVEVSATSAAGWTLTPIAPGVKPVLSLDGSGAPAMAFLFERVGEGFVAFAAQADGWSVDTVKEGYFYGPIDLSFGPDGTPYIAYHDHQADDFDPALGDLAVATRDQDRWSTSPARHDGHDGWDSTIVVDGVGTLHAAGVDPSQFGREEGVEYYVNDGGGWQVTAIGSGPIAYQYNVSLALDASGSPAISYYNDRDQDLMFAVFDGASWAIEAVETEGDVGKYSSLAFDGEGRAHISYFFDEREGSGTIRYAVRADGSWAIENVAPLDAFEPGNARRNSDLALDSAGVPRIAFSDTSGVWYGMKSDGGWEIRDVAGAGDLPLGQLVSIVLDASDVPHIAFYEVTNPNPLNGVVVYATLG